MNDVAEQGVTPAVEMTRRIEGLIPPRTLSLTNRRRTEPISHERAKEAAIRLIHSHFGQPDHAHMTIPLSLDDDDVVIMDYIEQQLLRELSI